MIVLIERKGALRVRRAELSDVCEAVYALTQLIPVGYVTSYKSIASVLGVHPRVVALCLKHNKKVVVVPCHRVVYSSRRIGGYSLLGLSFKKKLLEIEGVVFEDDAVSPEHFIDISSLLR